MIRIGIIGPSEIAYRRFMPALQKLSGFIFVGIAIADKTEWKGISEETLLSEKIKATAFINQYGGEIFESYSSLITSSDVDAIYIPLPPGLHFFWAEKALNAGKHVFIEKPATTSFKDSNYLVKLASEKKRVMHENYMFAFHQQLVDLNKIIESGEIGAVRLYRISFGFPRRDAQDFRYNKALGGGALFDAGGYTIKYATMLLGKSTKIESAKAQFIENFEVDISGSATLSNDKGDVAQVAFGMDNSYKCHLEVWGSLGSLESGRVLTAPPGFTPEATIQLGNETRIVKLSEDDAFMKSLIHFEKCTLNEKERENNYVGIIQQAMLIQQFITVLNH